MASDTQPQSSADSSSRKWWFKNVVVPIIGTLLGGGGIAAFVGAFNKVNDFKDVTPSVRTDGGPNVPGASFGSGSVVGIGGAHSTFNVTPPEPPHAFSRKVTLHQQESTAVQGVSIQSGFIGEWEGRGVYVELVVSDRGNVVFDKKAFVGATIPVRSDADESLTIVVDNVEQHPKDPTKTWEDLKKLGLAAEYFIERKAVLMVSGKTRSPEPEPPAIKAETKDDSSLYTINADL